ncbi:MAG: hypothetical protein ACD_4C00256G0002 [uncultured bacterium (gcode 4)]|uniref:DUF4357 domain-containing protein n=1 Tax=uncultured bacterium (gcode 4) TaxID=1234023 RepID=K2GT25_9BACT|nr:MAG: hypothetical protein ACD_4C00256G0002 [uncultured bacterium (gcode 4)]
MAWKTIVTYLIDWSPTWIKTLELSNWIGKAIVIPRAKLKEAKERKETNQPAIYFLFWKDEQNENIAYIWEAENLVNRLANHDTNKDFWEIVVAFISKDNNLTKADVKFLESKAIEKAKKINRFILKNGVEPVSNNLPEYQVAAMNEFLENLDLLISAIWYPILKDLELEKNAINNKNLYYCKWPSADASWIYFSEWLLVFKWSKSRINVLDTAWFWIKNLQEKLYNEKILKFFNNESYIFNEDYLFKSPSAAAWLILWRSANWWTEWKNNEWKKLDEIERKNLNS